MTLKFLGFNYRMTDFQAALGFNQMKKYPMSLKEEKILQKDLLQKFIKY